jgi:radical SAM protein with 4Fe4S-binding SPASM domain
MTATKKIGQLAYSVNLYSSFRAKNLDYSPESDMAASPFPSFIQLQTINACQASCVMCPYPVYKNVHPRGRMDDDLFDKVAAEIAEHSEIETFIPMLQNEPLLDKHIFEKITRFKERTGGRVRVELVTNGAFLTDENIDKMRESKLDLLDISLDAVSREVYKKIRIGLDYDEVLAGVERVISADLPATSVFVRLVKQKENVHEVEAFSAHWRKRGVSVFIYTVHNRVGAVAKFEEKVRLPERQVPVLHKIGRRLARAYLKHCPVPFSTANILHNGDMLMCVHDWGRKEVIGNVRDATIAELWNGPRMREIRARVHERDYDALPACRDCSIWRDGWF